MTPLRPLFALAAAFAGAVLISSCSTTTPDAADLDRYYAKAEEMARGQIAIIDRQLAAGQITQAEYDERRASIQNNIPIKANELAWTRHELYDAQKRQLGIPTGDSRPDISLPSGAAAGGFYRPAAQAPGGNTQPATLPAGGRTMQGTGGGGLGGF